MQRQLSPSLGHIKPKTKSKFGLSLVPVQCWRCHHHLSVRLKVYLYINCLISF